jgi:GT2 family glycosyltransferase
VGAVRIEAPAPPRTVRVCAVIPCYNRRRDAELLLSDLGTLRLADVDRRVSLSVILVDNASDEPLSTLPVPRGLAVEHFRAAENRGGSGGFNTGMARALTQEQGKPEDLDGPDYLWLLDSDVRLEPGSLLPLVAALEGHADLVAVGSALVDPATGRVHEIGGRVARECGRFEPVYPDPAEPPAADTPGDLIYCDYVAACSALVRPDAVRRAGLMPDVFLNADDVEWFVRLGQATGCRIAAVTASRATHPTFDRFQTWARYYVSRNCLGPLAALKLGPVARFRRALREVARATQQSIMGRDDLAALHLLGLTDTLAGRTAGPAPKGSLVFEAFRPFASLGDAVAALPERPGFGARVALHPDLRLPPAAAGELSRQLRALGLSVKPAVGRRGARGMGVEAPPVARGSEWRSVLGALRRWAAGAPADLAIIPARGRPDAWFLGRTLVEVVPEGFVIRRPSRMGTAGRALRTAARGAWLAARLAARHRHSPGLGPVGGTAVGSTTVRPTLSIVVLSYNRAASLERTLTQLEANPAAAGAQIIVVDNASTDGSAAMVRQKFPDAQVLALAENRGVAGFNAGVARATGEAVLILDDDAHPEPAALEAALDLLGQRPSIGAVALHPRHPASGASEWPFAERARTEAEERWPVMGCGNLVRTDAWRAVGGYEEGFFLYRNDVDLALKLLAAGYGVHFNPAWTVWHDSPAAAKKSRRWFELATRNWIWTARRHGRGAAKLAGVLFGWAWAHRLAGLSPAAHTRIVRGVAAGIFTAPPPLPGSCRVTGAAYSTFLRLRLR